MTYVISLNILFNVGLVICINFKQLYLVMVKTCRRIKRACKKKEKVPPPEPKKETLTRMDKVDSNESLSGSSEYIETIISETKIIKE